MPLLFEIPAVKDIFRHLIEQAGKPFDHYFSALTIALMITRATLFITGALSVALVAGDIVAKEDEEGTMCMLLARPVTRCRILGLKYLATAFYTAAIASFIGLSALAAGLVYEAPRGFFCYDPLAHVVAFHEFWPGLVRYLSALPLIGLTLLTVNTTTFTFSCLKMKPAAATVSALTIFFVDYLFHSLPFFEPIEDYFISTRLSMWMRLFERTIPWPWLLENTVILVAANATLLILAWAVFERRDFKA